MYAMAGKTFDFDKSLIMEKMIKKMEKEGYFPIGRAEPLSAGQTMASRAEGYTVVFRSWVLCLPSIMVLHEVLEEFQL
jgi:hypothetical protein